MSFSVPKAIIFVNGTPLKFINFSVVLKCYNYASVFSFNTIRFGQTPRDKFVSDDLIDSTDLQVEIYAGYPKTLQFSKDDLKLLIAGRVDQITYQPLTQQLSFEGRDYSSVFLDSVTASSYFNYTTFEVISLFASKYGFEVKGEETGNKIGSYFNYDFFSAQPLIREWDFLVSLAQKEGYFLYFDGQVLNFQPLPSAEGKTSMIYSVYPNSTFIDLTLERNLTQARTIEVTVSSRGFDGNFSYTARRAPLKTKRFGITQKKFGDVQKYQRDVPGLSQLQCEQLANSLAKTYSLNERLVRFRSIVDTAFTRQSLFELRGTQTDFDQIYYPETIQYAFSVDEGYTMTIEAKNHSPQNEELQGN